MPFAILYPGELVLAVVSLLVVGSLLLKGLQYSHALGADACYLINSTSPPSALLGR